MSDTQMPDRYRPDPWIDVLTWDDRGAIRAEIGALPLRDWLGVPAETRLGVAPKSPRKVSVGVTVPRIIDDLRVRSTRDTSERTATIKGPVMRYLEAEAGDTLRIHNGGDQLVIERRRREGEP